jgi:hypothetical protein
MEARYVFWIYFRNSSWDAAPIPGKSNFRERTSLKEKKDRPSTWLFGEVRTQNKLFMEVGLLV